MKNVINKIIVTLFVITLVTTVFNILPKSLANSNGDYTLQSSAGQVAAVRALLDDMAKAV